MGIMAEKLEACCAKRSNATSRSEALLTGLYTCPATSYRGRKDPRRRAELYRMAGDDRYLAMQSEHVADPAAEDYWESVAEPAAATLRWALQCALEHRDTPRAAHVLIRLGRRRAAEQRAASPYRVPAARIGRALAFADRYRPAERTSWYLLLAWRAAAFGDRATARDVLSRLIEKGPVPIGRPLPWHVEGVRDNTPDVVLDSSAWACHALARLATVDRMLAFRLRLGVLGPGHRPEMIRQLAILGDFDGVRELVGELPDVRSRCEGLLDAGERAAAGGSAAEAQRFLDEADRLAETSSSSSTARDEVRPRLAGAWARLGEAARAVKALDAIGESGARADGLRRVIRGFKDRGDFRSAVTLCRTFAERRSEETGGPQPCESAAIAECQALLGDPPAARATLAEIGEEDERHGAAARAAVAAAESGDLRAGTRIALGIPDGEVRAAALAGIAAHAEDPCLANGLVIAASQIAGRGDEAWVARRGHLALTLARLGFHTPALRVAIPIRADENRVMTGAREYTNDPGPYAGYYEATLREAALALASRGDYEHALGCAEGLRSPRRSSWVRHAVARSAWEAGEAGRAIAIVAEILEGRQATPPATPAGRPFTWASMDSASRPVEDDPADDERHSFISHCVRALPPGPFGRLRPRAIAGSLAQALLRLSLAVAAATPFQRKSRKIIFLITIFFILSILISHITGLTIDIALLAAMPPLYACGMAVVLRRDWRGFADRIDLKRINERLDNLGIRDGAFDYSHLGYHGGCLTRAVSRAELLTYRHIREQVAGRPHDAEIVDQLYDGCLLAPPGRQIDVIAVRNWALRHAARVLVAAGDPESAAEALDASGAFDRTRLVSDLTMGMGVRESEAPKRSTDWQDENDVRREIASAFRRSGRYARAAQQVLKLRPLGDSWPISWSLTYILFEQARSGDVAGAAAIMSTAQHRCPIDPRFVATMERLAEEPRSLSPEEVEDAFHEIGLILAPDGWIPPHPSSIGGADRLAEEARRALTRPADPDPVARAESLFDLVDRLAAAGDAALCREVAGAIAHPEVRGWATCLIIRATGSASAEDLAILEATLARLGRIAPDPLPVGVVAALLRHGWWMPGHHGDPSRRLSGLRHAVAHCLAAIGQFDRAAGVADEIADADFHSIAIRDLARALAARGRPAAAVEASRRIVHDRPEHLPAIAGALARAGARDAFCDLALSEEFDLRTAYAIGGQLALLDPEHAAEVATVLDLQGRYDNSIAEFDDAVGRRDELQKWGRYRVSEGDEFERACDAHTSKLRALGEYDEAIRVNTSQLEDEPGRPEPCCRIALIYLDRGRPDDAEEWFGRALRRDPYSAEGHKGLALVGVIRSREDPRVCYILEAARLMRDLPDLRRRRGHYTSSASSEDHKDVGVNFRRLYMYGASARHLKAAVRRSPQTASNRYFLGETYLEAGKYAEAAAVLEDELEKLEASGKFRPYAITTILRLVEADIVRGEWDRAREGLAYLRSDYEPAEKDGAEISLLVLFYECLLLTLADPARAEPVDEFAKRAAAYSGGPIIWPRGAIGGWIPSAPVPRAVRSRIERLHGAMRSICAWEPPPHLAEIRDGMLERGFVLELVAERGVREFGLPSVLIALCRLGRWRGLFALTGHYTCRFIYVLFSYPAYAMLMIMEKLARSRTK